MGRRVAPTDLVLWWPALVVEVGGDDELHGVSHEVHEVEAALEEVVVVDQLGQVVCRAAEGRGARGGEHVVRADAVIHCLPWLRPKSTTPDGGEDTDGPLESKEGEGGRDRGRRRERQHATRSISRWCQRGGQAEEEEHGGR